MSRSDPVSHFGTPCRVSEIGWGELDFLPTLDAEHQALLDSFYKNVKLAFGTAAMLESKDENFHKKINTKVKFIHEWNSPKPTDQSTTEFCAPGRESQERDGTQPILHAIMLKLAHVLGLERHVTQKKTFQRPRILLHVASTFLPPERACTFWLLPLMCLVLRWQSLMM